MDCILLRHGIAIDAEAWNGPDEARPLTEEGKSKVRRAAKGLAAMGLSFTHLLSSPLTRARQTAKLVQANVGPSLHLVECEDLAPGASPEQLTARLASFPSDSRVLCVGHEPLLSHTAGYWLSRHSFNGFAIKKSGALSIHFEGKAERGAGSLHWYCQPSQLRLMGMQKRLGRK